MHENPRRDRKWEHWPTERVDPSRLDRLRALFHPSGEAEVEELIAEHGRELEERARQLAASIADIERREQRTRMLRLSVERMLREGSAELDDRHAELNELAAALARREAAVTQSEEELAERRSEVGAVELRRAALERREQALAERESRLGEIDERAREVAARAVEVAARERRLDDERETVFRLQRELAAAQAALQERERRVADVERALRSAPAGSPAPVPAASHLRLFVADGYRLAETHGPAPEPGAVIDVDGRGFHIWRVGPSPFPDDSRRCACLEAVAAAPDS